MIISCFCYGLCRNEIPALTFKLTGQLSPWLSLSLHNLRLCFVRNDQSLFGCAPNNLYRLGLTRVLLEVMRTVLPWTNPGARGESVKLVPTIPTLSPFPGRTSQPSLTEMA